MNENIHTILFNTFITVSQETETIPTTLIRRVIDILSQREQQLRDIHQDDAPSHFGSVNSPVEGCDNIVDQWIKTFVEELGVSSVVVQWSMILKALIFYSSNMGIFDDNEIIGNEDNDYIERQINNIYEMCLCPEIKIRSRDKGFGKDSKIIRNDTAPKFWITQFNEETDYEKNQIVQVNITPPSPSWARHWVSQIKKEKKDKTDKNKNWRGWCKVTRATPVIHVSGRLPSPEHGHDPSIGRAERRRVRREMDQKKRESEREMERERKRREEQERALLREDQERARRQREWDRVRAERSERERERLERERRERGSGAEGAARAGAGAGAGDAAGDERERLERERRERQYNSDNHYPSIVWHVPSGRPAWGSRPSTRNNTKDQLIELQSLIDDVKVNIPEGVYIDIMKNMKEIYDKS